MKQIAEYSIYRNDTLVHIGSAKECAAHLGIKLSSFQWYATPTGQKRLTNRKNPDKCLFIERLEDDGDGI